MNPRLIKFAVELQTAGQEIKEEETINFKGGKRNFFNFLKPAKVTVPINRID